MASWRSLKIGVSIAWALLLTLGLVLGPAGAAKKNELIRIDAKGPVNVRADTISYQKRTESYLAEGRVEISRGQSHLMADRVRLFSKTMVAEAEGRVRLISPGQEVSASRLVVDLNGGTGKIYDGTVFIKATNFYLRGREIEKLSADTYRLVKGSFTTCDGSDPAWQITGDRIKVTIEGYGEAHNAAFRIKKLPVLWTPYIIFPAKFKRSSGFLFPQYGVSDRDGHAISLPYYWVIDESSDATFTVTYLSDRGPFLGGEYRYYWEPGSKFMVLADWLHSDKAGDELLRLGQNREAYDQRWWIRAKGDYRLFDGAFSLRLDLDLVSDEDYLREFNFGYNSFDATQGRFKKWFGREVEPRAGLTRTSKLNIYRTFTNAAFNASLVYRDDLRNGSSGVLQQLPIISFNATRQAIGQSGLYFQMGSSYQYLYREEGSTGHLSDLSPTISWPINFNDIWEFTPIFDWRQRFFAVKKEANQGNVDETGTSYQWTLRLENSTYLFRIYDFGSPKSPFKMKHAIRPFFNFRYQPKEEENDLAALAARNQDDINRFEYGIRNTFTSKTFRRDPKTKKFKPYYREFLRLDITQSFDLEAFYDRQDAGISDPRPNVWSEIVARAEFSPHERIYWQAESRYNPEDSQFTRFNSLLRASDWRGDALRLDYRYTLGGVRQLVTDVTMAVNRQLSLAYVNHWDIDAERSFETRYELRYKHQCWGFKVIYRDDLRERGIYFVISLGGLGEIFRISGS